MQIDVKIKIIAILVTVTHSYNNTLFCIMLYRIVGVETIDSMVETPLTLRPTANVSNAAFK